MQLSPPLRPVSAARRRAHDAPRTVVAAAPYLAPAPLAVAAAGDHRLAGAAAAAVVASSLTTAAVRAGWERGRLARLRRRVDQWLAWRIGQPPPDALIYERMSHLVSPPERRSVARALRSVRDLGLRPGMYRASVVNVRAAAANRVAIERLAARLEGLERPVGARGVALAAELLADGTGPLYNPGRAHDLGPALERALSEL